MARRSWPCENHQEGHSRQRESSPASKGGGLIHFFIQQTCVQHCAPSTDPAVSEEQRDDSSWPTVQCSVNVSNYWWWVNLGISPNSFLLSSFPEGNPCPRPSLHSEVGFLVFTLVVRWHIPRGEIKASDKERKTPEFSPLRRKYS